MIKGLQALKVLVMSSTTIFNTKEQIDDSVKTIEKELKALDIVKNKNVDVHWVKICKNSEEYNEEKNIWEIELTQKEFELLKGVLTND